MLRGAPATSVHRRLICTSTIIWALLAVGGYKRAFADTPSMVRGIYGDVGLINTPSARMAPDGEFYISADFFKNTQHYDTGFQILPWLEGSFRYSGLQHFEAGLPVYFDRSFALKARLWDETDIAPALAVGINDLVGTGIYSGEYVVATKQVGPLDFSIGLGWGRLANNSSFRNPLGALSSSFYTRAAPATYGGQFSFGSYFHGQDTGVFGGVSWQTPIKNLTLIGEYSSDTYAAERQSGNFNAHSQFNFGANYRITDSISLGVDWLYGDSLAGTVTVALDPVHPQFPTSLAPPPPPLELRTPAQQQAALNSLLQARDLYGTAKRREAAARNADFTDLLFRSGFSDIEIKGRTLVLSGSHTPYADLCLQYAQLSRTYDANIDGVSLVSDVAPRRTIKCATPRIASHFVSVAQISPAEILSKQPILIIDGATDSPASDAELGLATQKIRAAMQVQRLKPDAIHLSANEATIYYTNSTYLSEASAIGRIMRVLLAEAPTSIEKFRLIALNASIPVREFDILRAPLERDLSSSLDGAAILQNGLTQAPVPMYNPVLSDIDKSGFPRFSWAIFPQFRQSLFDPNQPFGVQFLAAGLAGLEISRGLSLNIEGEANLYDNFDTSLIVNSPNLPPVRTNFSRYFTKGKNGIGDLEADYRFRLSPDVFAIGRAGYLESMFAGAGGELLWRPENARWALGVDGYEVWQRGFDRLLDLQNYHVFTGHVSLYYQSPWYGLSLALRAGQYLAGDRGLTIELSRRFLTGIEIGVFATKTNVSTADFGEGSFDKGIMITIPLSWGLPVPTQNEFNTVIRPVQRDGGQRLNGDALLWGDTQRQSEGEILDHQEDLIIP